MKEFITTYIMMLVVCTIGAFFLLGFLLGSVWRLIFFTALVLAILITVFMKQESRIEALEKALKEMRGETTE